MIDAEQRMGEPVDEAFRMAAMGKSRPGGEGGENEGAGAQKPHDRLRKPLVRR